jgi:hypothetical protein
LRRAPVGGGMPEEIRAPQPLTPLVSRAPSSSSQQRSPLAPPPAVAKKIFHTLQR